MRTTYIKTNSKTQQHCNTVVKTLDQILSLTGLSKDEWVALMFEMGCQCVEMQEHDKDVGNLILTDVEYGFWAWWITAYLEHDKQLIENDRINDYYHEKQRMLDNLPIDFG